jgi:hypothetical protein
MSDATREPFNEFMKEASLTLGIKSELKDTIDEISRKGAKIKRKHAKALSFLCVLLSSLRAFA